MELVKARHQRNVRFDRTIPSVPLFDEQMFRFNERKLTDAGRFDLAIRGIVGKRLTFDQLTGKADDHITGALCHTADNCAAKGDLGNDLHVVN